MVIYLDILLFENLVVNLFLLYITARTLRVKVELRYILLAAAIGSMYVITLVYPQLKGFSSVSFKIIVAAILVLISFRKRKIIFNIKALAIFILYSMMLAGACIFLQYSEEYDINNFVIINFSYKKLMLSVMIIYMMIDRVIVYIKERKDLSNLVYSIDIVLKSSQKNIKAFLDTGNELREPATNLPVVIVEKSVFKDVDLKAYDKFYIPYRVVSGKGGKLQGFKPEYIKIHQGNETTTREVIVAFCEERLSDFNDYEALLSRGVM
ncbi:sigma-E processing peptidase SpoIIGA [Clostridiaceae bacterium UIB06]|nr:sigma-E processing peptidase SpoIIGA [Clostridiaceae bacterium UIB06]